MYEFEMSGQPHGTVLRLTGLCGLLPKGLEEDLQRFRRLLTSYAKARTWVAEQVLNRPGGRKKQEVNEVGDQEGTEEEEGAPPMPTDEELLAMGRSDWIRKNPRGEHKVQGFLKFEGT